MGKVAMEMVDFGVCTLEGVHHISGLEEMFEGCTLACPAKALHGSDHRFEVTSGRCGTEAKVGRQELQKVFEEKGWQIKNRCLYLLDRGMAEIFPGLAHGKNGYGKSKFLQLENFVGNKCLRDAWVAFENIG